MTPPKLTVRTVMPSRPIHLMWVEACEVLSEAERLQRQFFRPINAVRQPSWEPPIDLFETSDALYLTIALPGVDAQRIEVHLNGRSLVVSGFRPLPVLARAAQIHRLELPYGRFERRIALPAGRYELVTHQLQHGCLQINLHKLGA